MFFKQIAQLMTLANFKKVTMGITKLLNEGMIPIRYLFKTRNVLNLRVKQK